MALVRPPQSWCSSLGTRAFEWFWHCSPSLSVWASGDVISEDRGTSVQHNCLWQASSLWCLPAKFSCQREIFCWNEHVCENREHRRICTVALAWHIANWSLGFAHHCSCNPFYCTFTHASHNVNNQIFKSVQSTLYAGMWHIENCQMKAWNKKNMQICFVL